MCGSEEEEAEINEVFLREEVMIKTSRVEPHANIKGHRMSKYRKGFYNKFCHFVLKDGNQVETVVGQFGTGQFGTGQFGTRTIWHQHNKADNLAPRKKWHPNNSLTI